MADALAGSLGSRTGIVIALLLLITVVMVAGLWTTRVVDEALHESYATQLGTILEADAKALKIWIRNELRAARLQGEDAALVTAVQELRKALLREDDPGAALEASPVARRLEQELDRLRAASGHEWCAVVDRNGLILAASGGDEGGRRMTASGMAVLADAWTGRTYIERPSRVENAFEGGRPVPRDAVANPLEQRLIAFTPVQEPEGEAIAVLALSVPFAEFSEILSVARFGQTGETYAVDGRGLMVSHSRHESELREAGILPHSERPGVFYGIPVRDPGVDVLKEGLPSQPFDSLPLTRGAAGAVAGETGRDLDGYRDYRGVEVIGAWTWLSDLDLGMVTEVDANEAFAVLRPLRLAHATLVALLAAFALVLLGSTYSIRFLSRRIEHERLLGQYTLEGKIGEGAMGAVYRARHAMLRRPTALKMLRPDAMNEENLVRFEREVQLMSQLHHPNTVQIYDYGRTPEGVFYYVMEYLRGLTLADIIDIEGRLPAARVVFILQRLAAVLEEAHGIGLIHRDIKPLNILLCRAGNQADIVKLLDFGLVKDVRTRDEMELTSPELVGGTPPYIAPERLRDPRSADPRCDLYSLGGVAYNLLSGKPVFDGSSPMEICYKVLQEDPVPVSDLVPGVPPELADLVMQCLEREPDDRPGGAGEIIGRLEELSLHHRWGMAEARAWWKQNDDVIEARSAPHSV
ncbi:MAG: serine/threonine protein kinase [Myxococcota bacterium]|nr:serine/threonine protein kinase [Myxococcota bacterium]